VLPSLLAKGSEYFLTGQMPSVRLPSLLPRQSCMPGEIQGLHYLFSLTKMGTGLPVFTQISAWSHLLREALPNLDPPPAWIPSALVFT
jgi:hypothetical protein